MTPVSEDPKIAEFRILFRQMLVWLLLPFGCYLLAYLLINLLDLAAGRPWHFLVRRFGLWGYHQWSSLVIAIYYAVFIVLATVVSFVGCSVFSQRPATVLGWAVACGTYFLLLDITWPGSPLFWHGAVCGLIAGALGGLTSYASTRVSLTFVPPGIARA